MAQPDIPGYERENFTDGGATRTVYRRGAGPAVIVIAEIPGITPKVIEFADRVVDIGCSVWLPSLFGEPGHPTWLNMDSAYPNVTFNAVIWGEQHIGASSGRPRCRARPLVQPVPLSRRATPWLEVDSLTPRCAISRPPPRRP